MAVARWRGWSSSWTGTSSPLCRHGTLLELGTGTHHSATVVYNKTQTTTLSPYLFSIFFPLPLWPPAARPLIIWRQKWWLLPSSLAAKIPVTVIRMVAKLQQPGHMILLANQRVRRPPTGPPSPGRSAHLVLTNFSLFPQ